MSEVRHGEDRFRTGHAGPPCHHGTSGQWLAANADLGRIDAELLLGHVLDMGRATVIAYPETVLTNGQEERLNRLANRRREREPLAYILGRKEFYGLNFRVGQDVLVPRPETELAVELALRLARSGGRVVDLGTGSGCIAIALKVHRPDLRVAATDACLAALKVASTNASANAADIAFVLGDWLTCLRGPIDCIVANPPYVAADDPALAELQSEPASALVAGSDGLGAVRRIIEQAPCRMAPSACLILEHGYCQAPAVRDCLTLAGFRKIETHRDLAGRDRATVAFMES